MPASHVELLIQLLQAIRDYFILLFLIKILRDLHKIRWTQVLGQCKAVLVMVADISKQNLGFHRFWGISTSFLRNLTSPYNHPISHQTLKTMNSVSTSQILVFSNVTQQLFHSSAGRNPTPPAHPAI